MHFGIHDRIRVVKACGPRTGAHGIEGRCHGAGVTAQIVCKSVNKFLPSGSDFNSFSGQPYLIVDIVQRAEPDRVADAAKAEDAVKDTIP